MDHKDYESDHFRSHFAETGILVRAKLEDGRWGNVDIAHLKYYSLQHWLRVHPDRSEQVVYILLGHEGGEE